MSSLLEQAIIDATALKEAAIKNAENAILDKYSTDIREAVENLLEQDEEFDTTTPESPESPDLAASLPLGAAPEAESGDQEMIIKLDDLKALAEELADADARADGADPEGSPAEHPVDMEVAEPPAEDPTVPVDIALEEDIDLTDLGDLEEILEELIVDIDPVKSGWAGTPESTMQFKEEMRLAQLSATAAQEQNQDLIAARDRLSEQYKKLQDKNNALINGIKKIKENFDKVNLSNARLIYTNRILTNDSLNGRQKNKIVEALSKADSIEEAKVIFKTLEGAVGSVPGKAHPKSLRETIERPSATLPRRAPSKIADSSVADRMQILAGIKKLDK